MHETMQAQQKFYILKKQYRDKRWSFSLLFNKLAFLINVFDPGGGLATKTFKITLVI